MSSDLEIQIIEVVVEYKDKKKIVCLEEVLHQNNTPLRNFYIRSCLGNYVWIKTNDRVLAQLAVDTYFGVGFYKLASVKGAKGSDSVSCRASQTTRGQAFQRAKARVLNS